MFSVQSTQLQDNFDMLCNKTKNGEAVLISVPDNENVVLLSEEAYNNMQETIQKAKNNDMYLAMLDKISKGIQSRKLVVKTFDELKAYEQ